jgi:hypothetical protein
LLNSFKPSRKTHACDVSVGWNDAANASISLSSVLYAGSECGRASCAVSTSDDV